MSARSVLEVTRARTADAAAGAAALAARLAGQARRLAAATRVGEVVSGLGTGVVLTAVLAWVAGLWWGWGEVLTVAVLATLVLLSAVLFVLGRLQYVVTVELAQHRVTVGDRAVGTLRVRNASARPVLPSVMELTVGRGVASFPVPRLRAGDEHEDVFRVPTSRRAVIDVGPVRSVRSDPFGLLRREVVWNEPRQLVVHPRVVGLAGSSVGHMHDLEGRVTSDLSDSDMSFHALRDYVPGDDRRHIHWKTTARTGQLVVRQFEETRRSQLAVVLSTRADEYASPDEFELAVSASGSFGLQAIREDRRVTFLTPRRRLRGDARTPLLDDLAGIDAQDGDHRLADFVRTERVALADASMVVLVAGSRVAAADLRAASVRLPGGARAVSVQCVPGEPVRRHRIGDLTVLTLGSLDDLPFAMRRVND
ncbi:DUF58 domain-containing protein [Cellulomonas sp. PhB143]|uniref:DUF58 domain-containing protein n=1 Tax=Cellulomonas sp. PhB143 TaxID=2485186 RepID=UPI000F49338A|nr:DUF58 domain-containing protein [Cellulomonas sp. PhB143]ROS76725.1 uncharacterized protein (DUF58 family) [Cellulomonas sp. PhB143]